MESDENLTRWEELPESLAYLLDKPEDYKNYSYRVTMTIKKPLICYDKIRHNMLILRY